MPVVEVIFLLPGLHFGSDISSETAVAAAEVDGWIAAKLFHQLAFGKKYPNEQRKGSIIALGSLSIVGDYRCVPCFWDGGHGAALGPRLLGRPLGWCWLVFGGSPQGLRFLKIRIRPLTLRTFDPRIFGGFLPYFLHATKSRGFSFPIYILSSTFSGVSKPCIVLRYIYGIFIF